MQCLERGTPFLSSRLEKTRHAEATLEAGVRGVAASSAGFRDLLKATCAQPVLEDELKESVRRWGGGQRRKCLAGKKEEAPSGGSGVGASMRGRGWLSAQSAGRARPPNVGQWVLGPDC